MSVVPVPAVPSEGAGFYRLRDVPDGWEYRDSENSSWQERDTRYWPGSGELVEARPRPEPLVAVMLPRWAVKAIAQYEDSIGRGTKGFLFAAARKALEESR